MTNFYDTDGDPIPFPLTPVPKENYCTAIRCVVLHSFFFASVRKKNMKNADETGKKSPKKRRNKGEVDSANASGTQGTDNKKRPNVRLANNEK